MLMPKRVKYRKQQRGRMSGARAQRRDDCGRGRRVAQADGEVAQPALVADAPDRRAGQARGEIRLAPGKELDQRRAIQAVAHREVGFRARPRERVPRADGLAVVAAVHAIADERPELLRDRALQLDGQVRNAAARVELVGRADRLRGADVHALRAGPAMLARGRIHRQRQAGVHLAEEEPGACFAREEQRVLAAPADARLARELDLHHRRRVREHAVAERTGLGRNAIAQLLQPRAHHLVIVAPARIARDLRAQRVLGGFLLRGQVVHAAADDALGARHELGGTRAERDAPRHIIHLAVPAPAEPVAEPAFRVAEPGFRDADSLEAQLLPPLLDAPSERAIVHGRV